MKGHASRRKRTFIAFLFWGGKAMNRTELRQMVLAAILSALAVVLSRVLHALGGWQAGAIFLPMHIPVLLCGFLCGWKYGMLSGLLTPILAMLVSGMPNGNTLISMELELAAYGAAAGALNGIHWFGKGEKETGLANVSQLVFSLILAMLIGRAVYGLGNAIILSRGDSPFTWTAFIAGAFVNALPGILIQIVLIPALVMLAKKWKYLKGA
jgi:niacin transporter